MTIPDLTLAVNIMEPLYTAFGWLMRQIYFVTNNYGATIILFTVLLRAIMIPLYVKQHKNSLKQQQLTNEVNDLKRRYGSDQQGFAVAQQELFKEHGVTMTAGCLSSVIGLVLIWPVWRIISAPLRYISGVSLENITEMGNRLVELGHWDVSQMEQMTQARRDIPLILELQQNGSALSEMVDAGLIRADQLLNLDFLGINMGVQPSISPARLFGEEASIYLPLLIIPVIAIISGVAMQVIAQRTNPQMKAAKEAKELAKDNPSARTAEDQQSAMTEGCMKWMLPVMTVMTVFSSPAALGLYWTTANLMGIVQYVLMYTLYTRPVTLELKRREEERDSLTRKRPRPAVEEETAATGKRGKKNKSKGAN